MGTSRSAAEGWREPSAPARDRALRRPCRRRPSSDAKLPGFQRHLHDAWLPEPETQRLDFFEDAVEPAGFRLCRAFDQARHDSRVVNDELLLTEELLELRRRLLGRQMPECFLRGGPRDG